MARPIRFDVDARDVLKALRDLSERDAPFVTAYALTKTGQDIKAAEYETMQRVFDRPTRWTLNALQLKPATKKDLTAVVDYKYFGGTPADRYLGPQVDGGARRHKSHERALIAAGLMRSNEFAVPAHVQLDAHGNVPGKTFVRILSQLKASRDPMQNMTAKSKRRATRSAGGRYFVMRGRGVPDGVYLRQGDRSILPVLLFVRAPRYVARFPFYEIGRRVFSMQFGLRAREGWLKYVVPRLNRAA